MTERLALVAGTALAMLAIGSVCGLAGFLIGYRLARRRLNAVLARYATRTREAKHDHTMQRGQ